MTKQKHKNILRITNATRFRIFIGLCLALVPLVLFISCRDKAEKHSFSEVKGFNTPVQTQEIKMPQQMPTHPEMPAHATEMPQTPVHTTAMAAEAVADQPPPTGHLKWQLPAGWNAHAGSGMYYAIIKTSADQSARDIGVLALPGEAGGLQANAVRWAGQLGLQLSGDNVGGFLAKSKKVKTSGNIDVTVLDFGSLVQNDDASSMLVAVTKPQDDTYFIKMTGKKSELAKYKQDFSKFCNSLVYE